jgi:hypothetical protein
MKIYNDYIKDSILAKNEFAITDVVNIKNIKSTFFTNEVYSIVEKLIKEKGLEVLKELSIDDNGNKEYLDVLIFDD